MPAKSKSQQRLFGMVHAYNKGEFRGSPRLRSRVAALSRRVDPEDARHFAETPHKGLPDVKKAQAMIDPRQVQELYAHMPAGLAMAALTPRSRRRRTFLGSVLTGSAYGALIGGVGAGALGAFLAGRAGSGASVPPDVLRRNMLGAGLRMALWGSSRGAGIGAVGGGGLYVLDKLRGGDEQ